MGSIHRSQVYFIPAAVKASWVLAPLLSIVGASTEASAQVVVAREGTNTLVEVEGNQVNISGGQRSGDNANLFQSFEQFDVAAEQTANFVTTSEVQNVIGRVSGGQASTIDGTLQVSGSDASLYLMNPAGILIGPNAQLNLSGGFTATTATGIGFENGRLDAIADGDYSAIQGNPKTFHFEGAQTGGAPPGAIVNLGELSVEREEAIGLIGGTVINEGSLSAPEGSIAVAAVAGDRLVRISQENQLLSLEIEIAEPSDEASSVITGQSISEMLTGSGLTNATALITELDGTVRLGNQPIDERGGSAIASGRLSTAGEVGGNVSVLGDRLSLTNANIEAYSNSNRETGTLRLQANSWVIQDGNLPATDENTSYLSSNFLERRSENISLAANDGIVLNNLADNELKIRDTLNIAFSADANNDGFGSFTVRDTNDTIRAEQGNISITSAGIAIGTINTHTRKQNTNGNSGIAGGEVTLLSSRGVTAREILTYAQVSTESHSGDGGNVTIAANDGSIDIEQSIRTNSTAQGHKAGSAGNITLTANDSIRLGTAFSTAANSNSALLATSVVTTYGSGDGGKVSLIAENGEIGINGNINTFSVVLGSDATNNSNAGNGGDVFLNADGNISAGSIITRTFANGGNNSGQGGDIEIRTDSGLVDLGRIETSSFARGSGALGGGNVDINAGSVVLNGIDATAKADREVGSGGSITIEAQESVLVDGQLETYSQARNGENSGDGGNIFVRADQITTGQIESWSTARPRNSDDGGNITPLAQGSAGSVELLAQSSLTVGDVLATSSAVGNSADITLASDRIRLVGGEYSLNGANLWFKPASIGQNITLGGLSITPALDILRTDLKSIGLVDSISIGDRDGTGNILIMPGAIGAVEQQTPVDILGGHTLVGPSDRDYQFELTGVGQGEIRNAHLRFFNIENLVGGDKNDTFWVGAGLLPKDFGNISGGAGINTIRYEDLPENITVDLRDLSFSNIQQIISSADNSRLRGFDNQNNWTIEDKNKGSINGISFEGFSSLIGGANTDIFAFNNNGYITGSLDGVAGKDSLDYSGYLQPVALTLDSSQTMSPGVLSINSIESIIGSRFEDLIRGSQDDDTFQIEDQYAGSVNGITFFGIEKIEGGAGTDTLDYSSYAASNNVGITVDLENSRIEGSLSFENIETVIGTGASDIVWGSGDDETFVITGDRSATVNRAQTDSGLLSLRNIEHINGKKGNDTFVFDNLTSASGITVIGGDLNEESNRLITDGAGTNWTITGRNSGYVSEGAEIITQFSQIQNIRSINAQSGENEVLFTSSLAQITGAIDSGESSLTLTGDDISIGDDLAGSLDNVGGIVSGSGRLTIRPATLGTEIELGGFDSLKRGVLNITRGEIAAIQEGFEEIVIGTEAQVGGINFLESVSFKDSVIVRSQSDITLPSNQRLTSGGSIIFQAGGSVHGGSLIAESGGISSGDIIITAQSNIAIEDVITTSRQSSGNVTIRSATGSITAGGIATDNRNATGEAGDRKAGSVTLASPGSIEIAFIDARGSGNNSEQMPTTVRIETQDTFTATGSVETTEANPLDPFRRQSEASISTSGAAGGTVQIRYDRSNAIANLFRIGSRTRNGTAFGIETPTVTLLGGGLFNYDQGEGLEIVSNGTIPVNSSLEAITKITNVPDFQLGPVVIEKDPDVVLQQIESISGQAFEDYLGITSSGVNRQTATLQEIQETLAAVELSTQVKPALVYVYFVPDAASEASLSPEATTIRPDDQLEVMVITAENEPVIRRQWGVTRSQVDAASSELRKQATSQFSTPWQYLPPAQDLYDWIIRPVAETLEQPGIDSLGLVMDTGLRTLPIAALHDGDRFLVEKYSLGLLPSFSLTDINVDSGHRIDLQNSRVLAMGASVFEDQPNLPAVDAEVTLITEGLWEGDAFLNEDFLLKNLQAQMQKEDYGILHLATHSVFNAGDPSNSYIQLWDEKLSLDRISELALDKENLGLIILSACNTALGDYEAEYGFAGLAVSAGSQSALASLWPVSDEGTLGFMTQFYGQFKSSSVRAEALRQTQLSMINHEVGIVDGVLYGPNNEKITTLPNLEESGQWNFSHPFYWSAFTMIGNPW